MRYCDRSTSGVRPSNLFLAHQSRRHGVSLYDGMRTGVRASVCGSTLLIMNISETSWLTAIKFHLGHHWGRGLAALGFWPDRIRKIEKVQRMSALPSPPAAKG